MKKSFLILLASTSFSMVFAQSVVGKYSESAFIAPDKVRDMAQGDVVITQDKDSSKKIWVSNLIGNSKFYAIRMVANEDKQAYNIPPQTVAGYAVKLGCIVFDNADQQLMIALNNKTNCFGISQSDYDNVSVSKSGVKAGNVKVGANGEISGGGAKVDKNGVSVNAKEALAGVQYMGTKVD